MNNILGGIFDTGPNSVIFWQSLCWGLWAFILFVTPLATKYIVSKRDDELMLKQINDNLDIIIEVKTLLKEVEKYLAILKDRDGHRPRIVQNDSEVPQEAPDDMFVKIAGKLVRVKDLETLLNLADTQKRPIDKY